MILSQWCALRSTISARSSRQTSLNSICRVLIRFSQSNYSSFSQLPSAYCYPRNALYIAFYTQNRRALSRAFASGSSRVNVRTISSTGIPVSKSLSYTEKIKVILKEYGTVGFVFHMGMSLMSVGTCYLLVDNGLDVNRILKYFHVDTSSAAQKGASTFAIAYVFHKFLLPVRATITVVSVPVIVRHLRARGLMKGAMPKAKNSLRKVN